MFKKENISENSYYKKDLDYISSYNKLNNNPISPANKESVNKKSILKKDSIKSTDNESDLSQKKLSEKIKSSFFKNNFSKNSAFKQIINPFSSFSSNYYVPFNYYFNYFQQFPFINLCDDKFFHMLIFITNLKIIYLVLKNLQKSLYVKEKILY